MSKRKSDYYANLTEQDLVDAELTKPNTVFVKIPSKIKSNWNDNQVTLGNNGQHTSPDMHAYYEVIASNAEGISPGDYVVCSYNGLNLVTPDVYAFDSADVWAKVSPEQISA